MRGKHYIEFNGGRLRFPCDAQGNVDTCALTCIEAKRNYRQVRHTSAVIVRGRGCWQAGTYGEVVVARLPGDR